MPLGVGETFAGYTVVRRLGSGGMAEVYLAQHPRLPRYDALKLLGGNISADPSFRERFLREADLASRLWHPHIVGVHDRGEHNGQLWISMDFVDGADAASLLAQRYPAGMPPSLVAAIVTAVASALDYANRQGLLHRDVKPANILLTDVDDEAERRILLTDFGIARTVDDVSGLTATNMTVGTVAYTAPEQLMGEDIDGRADQYSLAATAYHLLTGRPPFRNSNPVVVIGHHLNSTPEPLAETRPELGAFDRVMAIALAKDPDDRFATCSVFARAFAAQAYESPTAPTPPGWYQDPRGTSGMLYWDGRTWHAPPPVTAVSTAGASTPRGGLPTWLLAALGVAVVFAIIAALLFFWSDHDKTTTSSALTSEITMETTEPTTPLPEATVSEQPSPTFTETASPRFTPPPSQSVHGTMVGTCDEGGTCGVKQRNGPYVGAPSLYPDLLGDGTKVTPVCQTTGDVRTNAGYGSSDVWYRLDNGSYVNSVYMVLDGPASSIPPC